MVGPLLYRDSFGQHGRWDWGPLVFHHCLHEAPVASGLESTVETGHLDW